MSATPEVITFGCRLNTFESEVMRDHARAAGLHDAVILNTCAVTNEAVRQVRQAIRRARRDRPEAEIIVTGCAAQLHAEMFADMPEVDRVLGNVEKMRPESFTPRPDAERVLVNDISSVRETAEHLIDAMQGRTRAFVQVQNGCDHRCTFCIIPFARGPSRSVASEVVVEQVRRLVSSGHREVVLTGVDTTAWGQDLPGQPGLGRLCRVVLDEVPELPRLRLSSIDSVEVDDELLDVIAGEERLMPHLHLSLQAGDDTVLARMKRRHRRSDAISFCERVRAVRPDVLFGADLIAGFPTETEEMFDGSLRLVDECDLTYLHVFPFSPRAGAPAARMPQVAGDVVKERARRLRAKGEAALARGLDGIVGTEQSVLVEADGTGRTPSFALVSLDAAVEAGEIVRARIERRGSAGLVGAVAG